MIGFLTSPWLIGPIAVVCCAVLFAVATGEATWTSVNRRVRLASYVLVVVLAALIALRFFHLVQRGSTQ